MTHVWQEHFGKPSRGGYHNKEWAQKMIEVGLMPSDTGRPGGKTTGQSMSDYIILGGRFEGCTKRLIESDWSVTWMSRDKLTTYSPLPAGGVEGGADEASEPGPKAKSKVKFTCPNCKQNAWGKPSLNILCGECNLKMEAEEG